jgi:prevent-host-death family protein
VASKKFPGLMSRVADAVPVSEFKARCLGIVEAVRTRDREFVITKRGEPVARLVPVRRRARSPCGSWKGLVEIRGDIVHCDWSEEFEATRE